MSEPLKEPKTYEQQIQIMKNRGLIIEDEATARRILTHVNYYRLAGYGFHLQNKKDSGQKFKPGTTFQQLSRLYEFDYELRKIFMSVIEPLEIYLKTQVAYFFGHAYGPDGHYHAKNFESSKHHLEYIQSLQEHVNQNKDSLIIKQHNKKYGGKMPIWVAVEFFSFSTLSKFYQMMQECDRYELSQRLCIDSALLTNWLHVLTVLRNTCAHFGRLYNVSFSKPALLGRKFLSDPKNNRIRNDSLFAYLVVLVNTIPIKSDCRALLCNLEKAIRDYSDVVECNLIGFPANWADRFAEWIK